MNNRFIKRDSDLTLLHFTLVDGWKLPFQHFARVVFLSVHLLTLVGFREFRPLVEARTFWQKNCPKEEVLFPWPSIQKRQNVYQLLKLKSMPLSLTSFNCNSIFSFSSSWCSRARDSILKTREMVGSGV